MPFSITALLAIVSIWPAQLLAADSARSAALDVHEAQLDAGYWISRLPQADRVVHDREAIERANAAMLEREGSLYHIVALPPLLQGKSGHGSRRDRSHQRASCTTPMARKDRNAPPTG